jgi:hypothetical protein
MRNSSIHILAVFLLMVPGMSSAQYSGAYGNGNNTTSQYSLYLTGGVAQSGNISGVTSQCPELTGQVYSVAPVPHATNYTWAVPPGWTISSGAGTSTISLSTGTPGQNGTISVTAGNSCSFISVQKLNVTVDPAPPSAAGLITGPTTFTPETTSIVYSIEPVTGATSYSWEYSGQGVTISGSGFSVTLNFTGSSTSGQLSVRGINSCGQGIESAMTITAFRRLTITSLFIEGLFAGNGLMNQAHNSGGANWPAGVADAINIELHDGDNYDNVLFSAAQISLLTNGTAVVLVPMEYTGSYYITVRHRNSIEVTTSSPVSFSTYTIVQSFGTPAQVFGSNLVLSNGYYLVNTGDVNQDGVVDMDDMNITESDAAQLLTGYIPSDLNGDGIINANDVVKVEVVATRKAIRKVP